MLRRINLIPPEERRRTETDVGLLVLIAAAVVVFAGMGFLYWHQSGVLDEREAELADVRAQLQQIQAQLAELSEYDALQQERVNKEELVQDLYAGRTLLSELLDDISLLVPENVWFDSLNLTAGAVRPAPGEAEAPAAADTEGSMGVQGNTFEYEDVARFMVRMEEVPALQDVLLGSAQQSDEEITQFQIQSALVNTQEPDTPLPLTQVQLPDDEEGEEDEGDQR